MPGLFNSSAHWPPHESVTELPELEGWVVRLVSISLEACSSHSCSLLYTHKRRPERDTPEWKGNSESSEQRNLDLVLPPHTPLLSEGLSRGSA